MFPNYSFYILAIFIKFDQILFHNIFFKKSSYLIIVFFQWLIYFKMKLFS